MAWQSKDEDGSDDGIYARLYSQHGWPMTPEFRVNDVTLSAQRFPQVIADRSGNYFVGWDSFHPTSELIGYEVKGKLYRHDLTPIGGEFHLNQGRLYNQMLVKPGLRPGWNALRSMEQREPAPDERGADPFPSRGALQ